MPAISLALLQVGLLARITRSTMLEVLRQDYIRTARAKGLPHRLVVVKHALANALIPITTVVGIIVSLLISGSVVTETLFSIPGIGQLLTAGGAEPRLSDGAGRPAARHRAAGAGQYRRRCLLRRCSIRGCAMDRDASRRLDDDAPSRRHPAWPTLRRLLHHRLFLSGLALFGIILLAAALAPLDRPRRPEQAGDALPSSGRPAADFVFGTDNFGRSAVVARGLGRAAVGR